VRHRTRGRSASPARARAVGRAGAGVLAVALAVGLAPAGGPVGRPAPAAGQVAGGRPPGTAVAVQRLAGLDRVTTSVAVSASTFASAPTVVLAGDHAVPDALAGGALAAAHGGPVLLTPADRLHPDVLAELERLGTTTVLVVGGPGAVGDAVLDAVRAGGREAVRLGGVDRYDTAAAVAEALPPWTTAIVAAGTDVASASVAAAAAAATGGPLLLVEPDRVPDRVAELLRAAKPTSLTLVGPPEAAHPRVEADLAALAAVVRVAGADPPATAARLRDHLIGLGAADPGRIWLAAHSEGGWADALAASAAVAARDGAMLVVDGAHVERHPAPADALRDARGHLVEIVVLGGDRTITAAAERQVLAAVEGPGLPGTDRRTLLPGHLLIGLYGHHRAPELGVLGEQPPDQVRARLAPLLDEARTTTTAPVLPVYDLIATLATAEAGRDGLHRRRALDDDLRPWLDAARADGALLLLDIQPGRADLLTEVQAYAHLLAEPDVGIGIDVEWAVGPHGTPGGGRIGTTTAAELNRVLAWLGEVVAAHRLPDKLVVVHHFVQDQILDVADVADVDGVTVVFEVDGIGDRAAKAATYRALARPLPHHNGLMVFLDQDTEPLAVAEALRIAEPAPQLLLLQ
jgi:hypothetical protein